MEKSSNAVLQYQGFDASALNYGSNMNTQSKLSEQARQFYASKASQYASMMKTLDPKRNLPKASHGINKNMTEYAFEVEKVTGPPKPPTREILQQMTLQNMIMQGLPPNSGEMDI